MIKKRTKRDLILHQFDITPTFVFFLSVFGCGVVLLLGLLDRL